jgi:hypothetical protein
MSTASDAVLAAARARNGGDVVTGGTNNRELHIWSQLVSGTCFESAKIVGYWAHVIAT